MHSVVIYGVYPTRNALLGGRVCVAEHDTSTLQLPSSKEKCNIRWISNNARTRNNFLFPCSRLKSALLNSSCSDPIMLSNFLAELHYLTLEWKVKYCLSVRLSLLHTSLSHLPGKLDKRQKLIVNCF